MALPTINEIIDLASSDDTNIANMLRKALVLSNKLELKDFESWIRLELNGYSNDIPIPTYRTAHVELKAKNPYYGLVPLVIPGPKGDILSTTDLREPISSYDDIIKNSNANSSLEMPFTQKQMASLMSAMNVQLEPVRIIYRSALVRVVDAVKTIVLDWVLKLSDNGIGKDKSSFSDVEKKEAKQIVQNIIIQNFQGILGNAENSNLNINSDPVK